VKGTVTLVENWSGTVDSPSCRELDNVTVPLRGFVFRYLRR
jgi:hypothetical protein